MKYTIHGTFRGRSISLTWEDGKLTGDELTCQFLKIESEYLEVAGPPCGPYTTENHLNDPLSALFIIRKYIDITKATGDIPTIPDIPDNAIS